MTGSLKSAHGALKRAMLFKFDWKCLAPARQEAGVSRRLAHIDFLLPGLIVTAAAVAVAPCHHLLHMTSYWREVKNGTPCARTCDAI